MHYPCICVLLIEGVAKKSRLLSPQEKKVVAYHEAGHAVVGWLLKNTDALMRVCISSSSIFFILHSFEVLTIMRHHSQFNVRFQI